MPRVSSFSGAIAVWDSNIVLKGKSVFANNTADFGGTTTVKCILFDVLEPTGRNFPPNIF